VSMGGILAHGGRIDDAANEVVARFGVIDV
jgi:hypothetical protein